MKLSELEGWPEKEYYTNLFMDIRKERSWNECCASIEPLKSVEIVLDKEKVIKILEDAFKADDLRQELKSNLDNAKTANEVMFHIRRQDYFNNTVLEIAKALVADNVLKVVRGE